MTQSQVFMTLKKKPSENIVRKVENAGYLLKTSWEEIKMLVISIFPFCKQCVLSFSNQISTFELQYILLSANAFKSKILLSDKELNNFFFYFFQDMTSQTTYPSSKILFNSLQKENSVYQNLISLSRESRKMVYTYSIP